REAPGRRNRLLDQFRPLPAQPLHPLLHCHPGDVPARSREARHETRPDRVASSGYDRDRRRRTLGRTCNRGSECYENIHIETQKLPDEIRKSVRNTLPEPVLDDDVLPFDVTKFAEATPKASKLA